MADSTAFVLSEVTLNRRLLASRLIVSVNSQPGSVQPCVFGTPGTQQTLVYVNELCVEFVGSEFGEMIHGSCNFPFIHWPLGVLTLN